MKKVVFQVNYEYTISGVQLDNLVLDDTHIVLHTPHKKKNFVHNYCRTCHSFQGSSIDDAITIFDWKFTHVDRKWIYTSITRATDLNKGLLLQVQREPGEQGTDDAVLPEKGR